MSNSIKLTVDFLSYVGNLTNNPTDSIKIKNIVEESTVTEIFRRLESIADSIVDQTIPLPDASTDYLLIFVDQDVSIKLNGSSDPIVLKAKTAGTKAFVFGMRGTISALTISNASGSAANIDVISVQI